jgi:hypothetical protein
MCFASACGGCNCDLIFCIKGICVYFVIINSQGEHLIKKVLPKYFIQGNALPSKDATWE